MKILCEKDTLNRAIAVVSRAAAVKSPVRSMEGILMQAKDGSLTLTGYDYELGIKTTIACRVEKEGEVVLPTRLLGNIVRNVEKNEISIDCDSKLNCRIRSGNADYNIKGMDSRDYPEFPRPSAENSIKIENSLFTEMCDYVIYAVSVDDRRPAHTGVQIRVENDRLIFVALDGFRLAVRERDIEPRTSFTMIVPAKTMREVRSLRADTEGKMSISYSRRQVTFQVGDYTVLSRLLEGDFLDYRKAIPEKYSTDVVLNSKKFNDCVERASLIITERLRNPLRLGISDNVMSVKCSTELGDVQDRMEIEQKGPSLEIAFNNRYILDALRNAKKDELVFRFSGPLSPCKITPKDDRDFVYLVLPVRYRND